MAEVFRMQTAARDGPELKRYHDIIFANMDMLDPEWGITHVKELKYKPGDIILCTYPKCGTHWVYNMIWKIKTLDMSDRPIDSILEFGPAELYEALPSPRQMITHMKPTRLPAEHIQNGGKIILLLRNPKDAMVSYYHHLKNAVLSKSTQTWDEFFQSYTSGLIPMGSFFDYVQQWEQFLKEKVSEQQVEICYYEDLKTDLDDNLARLNNFLGFKRDRTYLEKVKEQTTLSALREQDAAGNREKHGALKDENGDSVIYRKGVVGDWKNFLTVAQSELVDKLMNERLKHGVLNFKYEI